MIYLCRFIMQIQDERDLDDYLKTLLNYNDVRHKQFITNLKKQRGQHQLDTNIVFIFLK